MLKLLITIIALAFTVSFDGFGAGITYGSRKIRVPLSSIAIIAICSGTVMYGSMKVSSMLLHVVSFRLTELIGAAILTIIGLASVVQAIKSRPSFASSEFFVRENISKIRKRKYPLFFFEVLRTPLRADLDRSGNISSIEAIFLGCALSLDALGAGVGAALLGLPPIWTSFAIGTTCGLCLFYGLKVGYHFSEKKWMKRMSLLPGLLLIGLGMLRLF